MPRVQLLCLANSIKLGGRCVAGLRTEGGGWIRPVSPRADGTLLHEYRLPGGGLVSLLDVIEVEVTEARPTPHQPENWVLAQTAWRLIRKLDWTLAMEYIEPALACDGPLLGNTSDRVRYSDLERQPVLASLAIIQPQQVTLRITTSLRGNRQTRCSFGFAGFYYDLSITDPIFTSRLGSLDYGVHSCEEVGIPAETQLLLTISLGEPLNNDCFKLVAAVLTSP